MSDTPSSVKSIFGHAIDIQSPVDRAKYLDEACHSNVAMRAEVEDLIGAVARAGNFLTDASLGERPTSCPIIEQPGTLIGPYKLLEQIGEGGMGVVYVAEQMEPVRRRVALKIIKPGMDTKQVIARFEAERQALAMMDHPHIAKVLDAGTTGAGRPYFVMELVRGLAVTEYCDKARLSPRQRLELFIDVCHAVQHAHQKGVIHRDLKPSNVMITVHDGRPVAKVIDFGVAKAVGQQLTERTVYTAHTQLVGTPLYMSPEQADFSSQDVDTRSDVYSLGVLLYELLTGQTPFDKETLTKAGFDEMRRIIREDEPPSPSRRFSTLSAQAISTVSQHRGVDERHLGRVLRGELDWIVMKALEKDRSRRYESASALAADIQRYLSDEPVLACPPTTMYRFQKFARKHRPALVTSAAISICLILGTTVSAWQAVRATTAEAQANANEQKAVANAAQAQEKALEATEQRDEAEKQRDEVKILNEKLLSTQEDLKSTLYAAHMNLAYNAWDTGAIVRVQELLARHRPKSEETDPRGFEWYFLDRLCHAELLSLKHSREVLSVTFSPDGKQLVSSCADGALRYWDSQTGQQISAIPSAGYARNVAFSPDGKRLAAVAGNRLRVWDVPASQEVLNLAGADSVMHATVVFSPDGKRLANDGKVWDAQSGQELFTLSVDGKAHREPVAFSPDGKRVATAGRVKLWDAETGKELLTIPRYYAYSVAFSPDGKRFAGATRTWGRTGGNDVKVWDSESGQELLTIDAANHDGISCLAFSPDGQRLVGGSWDNLIRVWDVQTGSQLATLKGHTGPVDTVAISPDGQRLASSSRDGTVKIWDFQQLPGDKALTFEASRPTNSVWGVSFSPDGKRLASPLLQRPEIIVRDSQTGQECLRLKGHSARIWSVVYSPDGRRLASASDDNAVKLWDAESGKELRTLKGHTDCVMGVAFRPDGKQLASSSYDSTVRVWDAQNGELVMTLSDLPKGGRREWLNAARGVAYSPDGKRVACGANGVVKVWDAQSGQVLLTLKSAPRESMNVAFSPDGKRLVGTSQKSGIQLARPAGTLKIWDALTGEEILELTGHGSMVSSVVFSPDGKRLASGSWDGTVKLWNSQTGQDLLTLTGHTGYVGNVAFSPDGNRLASNDADGVVKIWAATPLPEKP